MRSLAAAYAVLALLAMPALLWAAEEPPATTAPATTEAAPAPAPETAPAPAAAADPAASPEPASPAAGSPSPASPAAGSPPAAGTSPAASPEPGKQVATETEVADAEPVARAAASGGVTIEDFSFAPRTITVDVGDTVTWTNRDSAGHSATADDGSFDTGVLSRGQSGSHTFEEAGTFAYHCSPHPNMTATVVVRAAGDTAGGGSGDPAADPSSGTATSTSSGSSLPATGLQAGIVLLGGVLLLGAGAVLRRRVEE